MEFFFIITLSSFLPYIQDTFIIFFFCFLFKSQISSHHERDINYPTIVVFGSSGTLPCSDSLDRRLHALTDMQLPSGRVHPQFPGSTHCPPSSSCPSGQLQVSWQGRVQFRSASGSAQLGWQALPHGWQVLSLGHSKASVDEFKDAIN